MDRSILFNGEMVRAILDGRKTQTRRVIKFPLNKTHSRGNPVKLLGDWPLSEIGDLKDGVLWYACQSYVDDSISGSVKCPHGKPWDRLWVRETFRPYDGEDDYEFDEPSIQYLADGGTKGGGIKWKPSIHMPRVASRITLEVAGVRVERVQDISKSDEMAEGRPVPLGLEESGKQFDGWFQELWDSINEKRGFGWEKNPWVWVVEFKKEAAK